MGSSILSVGSVAISMEKTRIPNEFVPELELFAFETRAAFGLNVTR